MPNTLTMIVARESAEETTFAIVKWLENKKVPDERKLLEALVAAITEWVNTTEQGMASYLASSRDYNIGDLSMEDFNGTLGVILDRHGICNLEIEVHSRELPRSSWSYDTHLVDETKLTEKSA